MGLKCNKILKKYSRDLDYNLQFWCNSNFKQYQQKIFSFVTFFLYCKNIKHGTKTEIPNDVTSNLVIYKGN